MEEEADRLIHGTGVVPSDASAKHQSTPPLTFAEKKMIVVLTLLYFIQGIPLGFWGSALPVLFTEAGSTFESLAILPSVLLPFSFKMITAPLIDTFYVSSIGKRRSYIIPIQYVMALMFLALGFADIDQWIVDQRVAFTSAVGFVLVFCAAQQDVAVDGWVLTALSEHHVHIGASCQSIGQTLGQIYAANILISLNSKSFCNNYLFSVPQTYPLLSLSLFCFITGVIIFGINVYVNFFTSERREPINLQRHHLSPLNQVRHSVQNTVTMMHNKHICILVFYLLTFRYGFAPLQSSFVTKLQILCFPKETLSMVQTLFIPFAILIPYVAGTRIKQGREFTNLFWLYKIRFIDCAIQYFIVTYFDAMGGYNTLTQTLSIASLFFNFCLMNCTFVIHAGFFNRISDTDVGGTYLTFLNSCHNLGNTISASASLYLIGFLGFDPVVLASFVYMFGYYWHFRQRAIILEKLDKSKWRTSKLVPV